jgi:oligosaccharide repeat unit polymerase
LKTYESKKTVETKEEKVNPFLGWLMATLILLLVVSVLLSPSNRNEGDYFVHFSFFVNGVIALVAFIKNAQVKPFSLVGMHWLFVLFFFFITPLAQYSFQQWPMGYTYSDTQVLSANFCILLWIIIFLLGSTNFIGRRRLTKGNESDRRLAKTEQTAFVPANGFSISKTALFIFTLLSAVVTVFIISNVGIDSLFATRTDTRIIADTSSMRLVLNIGLRSFLAFTVAFCVIRWKGKHDSFVLLVVTLAFLIVCCFPLVISRYMAGAIYFGILIHFFGRVRQKKYVFYFIFVFLFIILFPTLGKTRTSDFSYAYFSDTLIVILQDLHAPWLTMAFDAFSVVMNTLTYIDNFGISYGYQLLGAMLFFIPRTFWITKPFGSGQVVYEQMSAASTNIASPPVAEGLINFGILGIIMFALLMGIIARKIDDFYWNGSSITRSFIKKYVSFFYPFLIPLAFFMFRGDLMSSFAYTTGFAVVSFAMCIVNNLMCSKITR